MNDQLRELLKEEVDLMNKAKSVLMRSYSKCTSFIEKENYSEEEEDKLEALTSRFSRLSDMLFQKIWKTIFMCELEIAPTVRDKLNKAEKLDLIESANVFEKIRQLRNKISHEYTVDIMRDIYVQTFNYTLVLIDGVGRINDYIDKKNLI